jgi:hypothetical protein
LNIVNTEIPSLTDGFLYPVINYFKQAPNGQSKQQKSKMVDKTTLWHVVEYYK